MKIKTLIFAIVPILCISIAYSAPLSPQKAKVRDMLVSAMNKKPNALVQTLKFEFIRTKRAQTVGYKLGIPYSLARSLQFDVVSAAFKKYDEAMIAARATTPSMPTTTTFKPVSNYYLKKKLIESFTKIGPSAYLQLKEEFLETGDLEKVSDELNLPDAYERTLTATMLKEVFKLHDANHPRSDEKMETTSPDRGTNIEEMKKELGYRIRKLPHDEFRQLKALFDSNRDVKSVARRLGLSHEIANALTPYMVKQAIMDRLESMSSQHMKEGVDPKNEKGDGMPTPEPTGDKMGPGGTHKKSHGSSELGMERGETEHTKQREGGSQPTDQREWGSRPTDQREGGSRPTDQREMGTTSFGSGKGNNQRFGSSQKSEGGALFGGKFKRPGDGGQAIPMKLVVHGCLQLCVNRIGDVCRNVQVDLPVGTCDILKKLQGNKPAYKSMIAMYSMFN